MHACSAQKVTIKIAPNLTLIKETKKNAKFNYFIATEIETWFFDYDLETKRQSAKLELPSE